MTTAPYSKAFSASGLELADRCRRAHWLRYHDGVEEEPEREWSEISTWKWDKDLSMFADPHCAGLTCTARARSLALGKAVHACIQRYYEGGDLFDVPCPHVAEGPPCADCRFPAEVALSGLHFLPHPSECVVVQVEEASVVQGIPGTPDLVCVLREDCRVILCDHKTCRDFVITTREGEVIHCQKDETTLRRDRQVCRYALGVMNEFSLDELECRWVYYKTGPGRREARATVFAITRAEAQAVVDGMVAQAIELQDTFDSRLTWSDIAPSITGCKAYGGCAYNVDRGGPCNPPKTKAHVKSYVPAEGKRRLKIMADTSETAWKKFAEENGIDLGSMSFKEKLEAKKEWAAELNAAEAAAPAETPPPAQEAAPAESEKPKAPPAAAAKRASATKPDKPAPVPPADTPLGVPDDLHVEILVTAAQGRVQMRFPAGAEVRAKGADLVAAVLGGAG